MEDGLCSKNFPKEFSAETRITKDGYPQYKRRIGNSYEVRGSKVDNSNVVPYNRYLLERFNCHINVEVCTSVSAVKYIFKYIFKCYDCAEMRITDNNEIDQYVNSRYVAAPEACWRLLKHKMYGNSHKIYRLPVHLPQEQMIIYEEGAEADAIRNSDLRSTSLLAYFKLNEIDSEARNYLYTEIPFHYTFKGGEWNKRKYNCSSVITRLYSVSPSEKERFSLRVLLLNVKGAKSFDDLKSYNGVSYATFHEAVEARGLLLDDKEWDRALQEAAITESPFNIRSLFGYICTFNNPRNADALFEKYFEDMAGDFKDDVNARDKVLSIIKDMVNAHGWSLTALGLPEPEIYTSENHVIEEDVVNVNFLIDTLNIRQKKAFDDIVSSIGREGGLFFLDGPAGSGKTYLYNVLNKYLKISGKNIVQMATTGIAADLLDGGRTMHSTMKLPVPLTESSVSKLQINTPEGQRVAKASLLLIDEVSMMSKHALNAIDEVLKRLCGNTRIFGGKTLLLGGDFRQTANIVLKGSPVDIIENSLISSRLWRHVKVLKLSMNMRSEGQDEFNNWLLDIGNGTTLDQNKEVEVPQDLIEEGSIVKAIYGDEKIQADDMSVFDKVILVSTNENANQLNSEVLEMVEGTSKEYLSADSIVSDDVNDHLRFPIEFLNAQQPSGMPPYKLNLKVGAIVMLLRNLNTKSGLLNGTRICIKYLRNNFIVGEILGGRGKGKTAIIPRIDMMPSETMLPFVLKRRQFPVILSYAMTIHKAQGQSFSHVGVYLPDGVFSHGQLYVALSRVRKSENLRVKLGCTTSRKTKNIVFPELLRATRNTRG